MLNFLKEQPGVTNKRNYMKGPQSVDGNRKKNSLCSPHRSGQTQRLF